MGYYARSNGFGSKAPFFLNYIRHPYTNAASATITETIVLDSTDLYRVYAGVGGRFMEIQYVYEATETTPTGY